MKRHHHNTRLTPERPKHGGNRPGSGRPVEKENLNPNVVDSISLARELRHPETKDNDIYQEQQDQLVTPRGRSWSYHECSLLLTVILGLIMHHDMIPSDALRLASSLTRRSYKCLQQLWSHWRDEREVYIVSTDTRGAGAPTHINHSHHISAEAVFHISEYIRDSNGT